MVTHRQLQEAKEYINFEIKEGRLDEKEVEGLSDEEYVAFANKMDAQGTYNAEQDFEEAKGNI